MRRVELSARGVGAGSGWIKTLALAFAGALLAPGILTAQITQPLVAIHDSELTRALETMPASPPTPMGAGTTSNQWWTTDWHYFVMPESMKEALRSDGTAFTVVGDSNVTAGVLISNGLPRYPIVISLASEAIRTDEIAQLTNYVAAGGFLFVGSSSFTCNTNGTTRNDFALANQMGIHMIVGALTNWTTNYTLTVVTNHYLVQDLPAGQLTWRMPSEADEISWGVSPNHIYSAPHDLWQVSVSGNATVLAVGDNLPFLVVKPYGKGYFIYEAAFQPLVGHGGFAPGMYAYMILRRAIEWAFSTCNLPVPKLSPWPYQYNAAFMMRHDLEDYTNEMARVSASAQAEFIAGAKGDYYMCTGTIRDDTSGTTQKNIIINLRQAVTNYGATIGPHNGGLKNPVNLSLQHGDYDYWHWGPDEALDVSPPPTGYLSGKAYATASVSNSFNDVEGWLSGITNGLRSWVACYFNATREDSYDLQSKLGVNITGDQKISPFPHWTLSTVTPNKRYFMLSEPVSDWFVGGLVAQSMEPWHPPGVHTFDTVQDAVDFYYGLGSLINVYSHELSTGQAADAAPSSGNAYMLVTNYMAYCLDTNLHPRVWSANGVGVYQWWLQRSNAQISVNYSTNGYQSIAQISISGSLNTSTAVEVLLPGTNSVCGLQVSTNGVLAGTNVYRTVTNALTGQQTVRVLVGKNVSSAVISYYPFAPNSLIFSENFDGVTAPNLPSNWSTSASGAQSPWVTQASTNDTPPNAAYSTDATNIGVNQLVSPPISLPPGQSTLTFANNYDLETGSGTDGFDGGVLEIKIGTNSFVDIVAAGGTFVSGGYTSIIDSQYGNPLAGRQAWSGNSGGFIPTVISLPATASGQTIQLQWRCGTDNANGKSGWRIDSVSILATACMCCGSSNTPPVLPNQPGRTIAELTPLSVTNTATDPNTPLMYNLLNPPNGALISGSGVITWTPQQNQSPSTNTITTTVTDSGNPPLTSTNSFTVVVQEVNVAPVLSSQSSQTINELTPLSVNNAATESDIHATLGYRLVNPPLGAAINGSGLITWTPQQTQSPSTNTFTTIVTNTDPFDPVNPHLSATNSFTVTVHEVNTAPVLPNQTNRTIAASTPLAVTNTASESNIHSTLGYRLVSPPAGAAIDGSGIITWTPNGSQNLSTNLFTTIVTNTNPYDLVNPHLSATNTFTVVVNSNPVLLLDSTQLISEGCFPTNNVIDPGETVTVLFSLKNVGTGNTTNLVVTLLQTNGIVPLSAPQTYGVLLANGSSVTQPFTFAASGSCGSNMTAVLQLQDGSANLGMISNSFILGQSTVLTQNFDTVTAPALPAGWNTSSSGVQSPWVTATTQFDTAPNAAYSTDANNIGVNELDSPAFVLPAGTAQLTFRHHYAFEANANVPTNGYDGGVVEIKIGTNAFTDITNNGGSFVLNGYNRKIDPSYSNPLTNRWAFSGTNSGFVTTTITLPPGAAGQTNQIRWRAGSDNGNSGGGWWVDSILVTAQTCCANAAPTLPNQTNRTVVELTTLTVTNTATSLGTPANPLLYSLVNPPAGASINSNGVITWTPQQNQSPSTNTITTAAVNSGVPALNATNSFTVVVREVNVAPSLPNPNNLTINELVPLTVTNTATNANIHSTILGYGFVTAPSGVAIDANGVITWTPQQTQSPGAYTITTVVTNTNPYDQINPQLTATNSFTVTVREVNVAPVLPIVPPQTVNELTLLTVTNTAGEANIHASLGYMLINPPAGMTIDTNGIVTWTPQQTQSPGTNTITTVVTNTDSFDTVNPHLSATNTFIVVVKEVNVAPTLPAILDQTVNELTLLTVTNAATNANIHSVILGYALVTAPAGMNIDTNGVITWTPQQNQSPGTNTVTTIVTNSNPYDTLNPQLTATNTFTVVVREVNTAPVLPGVDDQTVNELTPIIVTNTATSGNIHSAIIGYALLNPPSGAAIDTNGVITWTPQQNQSPGTNMITTVVTNSNPYDTLNPQLTATNSFTVVVREVNTAPALPDVPAQYVDELMPLVVTNTATNPNIHSTILGYGLISPPSGMHIDGNGIITWTPQQTQSPGTNIIMTVVTNANPYDLANSQLTATNNFVVIVREVNIAPALPIIPNQTVVALTPLTVTNTATNANIHSTIVGYGLVNPPAGMSVNGNGIITWTPADDQSPGTNTITTIVTNLNPYDAINPNLTATNMFMVTVSSPPAAPLVLAINLTNGMTVISWDATRGRAYAVQYKNDIFDTNWSDVSPNVTATCAKASAAISENGAQRRYYRVMLVP